MLDRNVWILRTSDWEDDNWNELVMKQLKSNFAPFGWSGGGDLRQLQKKEEEKGWDHLSDDEKDYWASNFLLRIKEGDYLVYIHRPKYNYFIIAKAEGEYRYEKKYEDFNHGVPCTLITTLDGIFRYDPLVHNYLRPRLIPRARWWSLTDEAKIHFQQLLTNIGADGKIIKTEKNVTETQLNEDTQEALKHVANKLYESYPGKELETVVKAILEKMGVILTDQVEHHKGSSDFGADLSFDFENEYSSGRCAVQVKCWKEFMNWNKAVEDIKKAFEHEENTENPYSCGLIVTTATQVSDTVRQHIENLQKEVRKKIKLIDGVELARLYLKYLNQVT